MNEQAFQNSAPRTVLRWPEVHRRTGRSRSQVWRDIRAGRFPVPINLGGEGGNAIGWYEDEIMAWQASRPRVAYAPKDAEAA